jgi:U32 family peptidase
MKNKYELLAPVGNFEMLHAAIKAGADAVYFGIEGTNMREGARNFKLRELAKVKKICEESSRKVKRYLTLNTVVYNEELANVEIIIKKAREYVDAIICWDNAIIDLCRKHGVEFHVSTQASISNSMSAKFYKELGATRAVLARELNLKQIKKISKIIDIECFCHGAMCVAVSGRCFTSQFVHGISANRGQCAQPCRRAWEIKDDAGNKLKLDSNRVMSSKDLCTLPFIEKMKKAGIKSFKIEGRNRSSEYVYTVTKVYRRALDNKLSDKEIREGIDELKQVYNRGFSSGFFLKMPTADDFSYSENGEQTEIKEYIGRVEKYWSKAGAASVLIHAGKLKVGDEVYLIGSDAPIVRTKIESMEKGKKDIDIAEKGDEVGVKLPRVKKGTKIYLIKKR